MTLAITYWTASGRNPNIPGAAISDESVAISGASAQSAATPANADYVSLLAGEVTRFLYNSANPTALATSTLINSGERIWLDAKPGYKVAGIAG